MAIHMKGLDVALGMRESLLAERDDLMAHGIMPKLAIVRVGERAKDLSYERGALKRFENLGIAAQVYAMPENISQDDFDSEFKKINDDPNIHGILMFRPLPEGLSDVPARNMIDPRKDVDGMGLLNLAKLRIGDEGTSAPCTPSAVMEMLNYYNVDLNGKEVVVVGRSLVVGRPLAMLMLNAHATVTICHSRTVDLPEVCRRADVLVTAVGKIGFITQNYVADGSIIVDVGINVGADGKIYGDVDFASVEPIVSMISPVPGGVGSVTTSVLAKHTLHAARLMLEI